MNKHPGQIHTPQQAANKPVDKDAEIKRLQELVRKLYSYEHVEAVGFLGCSNYKGPRYKIPKAHLEVSNESGLNKQDLEDLLKCPTNTP